MKAASSACFWVDHEKWHVMTERDKSFTYWEMTTDATSNVTGLIRWSTGLLGDDLIQDQTLKFYPTDYNDPVLRSTTSTTKKKSATKITVVFEEKAKIISMTSLCNMPKIIVDDVTNDFLLFVLRWIKERDRMNNAAETCKNTTLSCKCRLFCEIALAPQYKTKTTQCPWLLLRSVLYT